MKYYLVFLLVCFFAGWLLHKLTMRQMTVLLIIFSMMLTFGYFFLNFI